MKITEGLQGVVTALQASGLTADTDTDKLQPPCAWVAAEKIRQNYLDGSGELDLGIYLIAPDHQFAETMTVLQKLLDQALDAVTPDGEIELDQGVQTSAGVLPAFKIPLTVKVEAS